MIDTMSIEDMKGYKGAQSSPDNFDCFWKNLIDKLPIDQEYKLVEKDFAMDFVNCYELYFQGTHNSTIYSKCMFPKNKIKFPVVFMFHGYQGRSSDWSECLKYVAAGIGVVCMDVRGQAGNSIDNSTYEGNTSKGHIVRGITSEPENLFFTQTYLDTYQLISIVSALENVDESKLYTFGASQGGALALVAAALNDKISMAVSIYPFLSDFKRVLELGDCNEPYNELFRYFKFSDPFHTHEKEILNKLSYIDVKNFAYKIKAKVKLVVALEDTICHPSTQFAIYNRLGTEKEVVLVPEYGHQELNVKVNDLVFNWLTNSKIEI